MKNPIKRRLQLRFVLLAMAALLVMQCAIVGLSICGSYRELVQKSDVLLQQLRKSSLENAHWFSATVNPGKGSVKIDRLQSVALTQQQAADLARKAIHSEKEKGFVGQYRYHVYRTDSAMRILFLSRSASLEMFRSASYQLVLVSVAGLALMCCVLSLISGWVVAPLVDNQNKQKQFISAAGHQLKTPLTVISADAQLLRTEIGESPWIDGILEQVSHLTDMTAGLVELAKADEYDNPLVRRPFDFSETVRQVLLHCTGIFSQSQKKLSVQLQPGLICDGNEQELRQLVAILLDNGFRYCPEGGDICVQLYKKGARLHLQVSNSAPDVKPADYTQRFYRGENAAGVQGSGLGLSIAKTVVRRHQGKLLISAQEGIFCAEVILH